MKEDPQKVLWLDVENLKRGLEGARTFLLGKGVVSMGFSMKGLKEGLREKYPQHQFYLRPTGGGLVFHGRDVCFGLSVPVSIEINFRKAIYRVIGRSLTEFFEENMNFTPEIGNRVERRGLICSRIHAPGELLWNGRKLCGMALRVMSSGFLLQGTLNVEAGENNDPASVSLSEVTGKCVSRESVAEELSEWLTSVTLPGLKKILRSSTSGLL